MKLSCDAAEHAGPGDQERAGAAGCLRTPVSRAGHRAGRPVGGEGRVAKLERPRSRRRGADHGQGRDRHRDHKPRQVASTSRHGGDPNVGAIGRSGLTGEWPRCTASSVTASARALTVTCLFAAAVALLGPCRARAEPSRRVVHAGVGRRRHARLVLRAPAGATAPACSLRWPIVLRGADIAAVNLEGTLRPRRSRQVRGARQPDLLRLPGPRRECRRAGRPRRRRRQRGQQPRLRLRRDGGSADWVRAAALGRAQRRPAWPDHLCGPSARACRLSRLRGVRVGLADPRPGRGPGASWPRRHATPTSSSSSCTPAPRAPARRTHPTTTSRPSASCAAIPGRSPTPRSTPAPTSCSAPARTSCAASSSIAVA